jgi:hypothetical protein
MRKVLLVAVVLGLGVREVLATQDLVGATLDTPNGNRVLHLPEAADNAPVISLGVAIDPQSGQEVHGYAVVRYKDGEARPAGVGGGKPKSTACYGYLASGAKWKGTPEPFLMNGENTAGMNVDSLIGAVDSGIDQWEDATDGAVDLAKGVNVMGTGSLTNTTLVADTVQPDGANEVYLGEIDRSGAIAVTIVWGIFSGPPFGRQLVEWDQVYDQVDFDWSVDAQGDNTRMDFPNISVHELGHAFGMADLYTAECSEETMFGYGTEGETKKRSLNAGDIIGINGLY